MRSYCFTKHVVTEPEFPQFLELTSLKHLLAFYVPMLFKAKTTALSFLMLSIVKTKQV